MGGDQVSGREPALRRSGECTRWVSSRCKGPEVTTPSVGLRLRERPAAWSTSCQTLSSSRLDKKLPWGRDHISPGLPLTCKVTSPLWASVFPSVKWSAPPPVSCGLVMLSEALWETA